MKETKIRKRTAPIIILTAVLMIVFCFSLIISFSPLINAGALDSAGLAKAYQAGSGAELWNTDAGKFNGDVLDDITTKLFGNEDPVEYVKKMKDTQTDSYVIPASTINAKVNPTNPDYGMVVKLDGMDWMVTSLTLAEIDGEENVVATLYLADIKGTSQYYTNASNTKGNNAYCRSTIRNHLLTNSTWALFQDSGEDSFAHQFLVQPQYIKYQETQSMDGRQTNWKNCPNDAWGTPKGNWHSGISYSATDMYDGKTYDSWKYDYIWLPSMTETGASDYGNTTCIWKLSNTQRMFLTSKSWLRSGRDNSYDYAGTLDNFGIFSGNSTRTVSGVRPAIHLNLTAAGFGTRLKDPETVTTTYNGKAQTVKSVYDVTPTAAAWYNPQWYEHESNYVIITQAEMVNAGTYWAKAEIQQAWIDAVYAKVDEEGAANDWDETKIAEQKEKKRPRFSGAAVSDAEHVESETVRWFQYTIIPKEITVNKPTFDENSGKISLPTFADETELYEDKPALAVKYTGTAEDGTEVNQIDVMPNKRGTYTAQAILVNSESDKTEYVGNYIIKDPDSCTCTVTINRSRLAIPMTAEGKKGYSGEKLSFPLTGYSTAWAEVAQLQLPADSGMAIEGDDTNGWFLTATNVGTYTVTASLKEEMKVDWCWNTSDFKEESVDDQTLTIIVTRKTLFVDFTTSSGSFFLQSGAEVTFGVELSNAYAGDDVKLTVEYYNTENPEAKIPVPEGTLNAVTVNPGTYVLIATLSDDRATGNKNYVLDGGKATQEFTVSAKKIEINSVTWQYSQNNGTPTSLADGAGASDASPFELTYNGVAYVFSIVTTGLADLGVKIDATYETNGYKNSSQLNATANAVAISVRLIPLEEGYAFLDESGNPLEQQYKIFTLYAKVNKADVDFSQVKWSADELEFNAVNQQVTIESGFPSFLTPIYNHPSATNVDEYDTKVVGVSVSDATVAANYNIPNSTQVEAEANLAHHWKIVKKRIVVTWTSAEQTEGGTVIFVPSVSDNSLGAIVYSYFKNDKTTATTLDEIFNEYSEVETHTYWVCAKLKPAGSGGSAYNETNCVLIEGGNDVTATGSFSAFTTGENKTPVRVGIVKATVVYNKAEQPVEIEFEGGSLTIADFTVTYKNKDGSAFSGVPQNAGEYKAVIALDNGKTDQYAITGQCEFDYVIEKFTYDLTGMKWVDTENGNAEYTEAYVYKKGVSHTLSYIGGDDVDGLTVNYTPETELNLSGADAGNYHVVVTFDVRDTLNYNVPENVDFTWTITPFTPDLSEVTWNYNTESPFYFTIVDGTPVKYKVVLNGIPEGLEDLIVYGEDTGEYSDAGSHVTTFAINEENPERKNYGELVFASGLDKRLVWEIKTKLVEKPAGTQTKVFRAEGYSFAEITNLPEDYAQYFDVQVLNSAKEEVPATDGTWTFVNVDKYQINLKFKAGMNTTHGSVADNVKWSDNARLDYPVKLTIEQLILDVEGWIDGSENARPTLDCKDVREVEKFFDYVIVNTETSETLSATAILEYDTVYTIALKIKAEFTENVAVNYLGAQVEETLPYAFLTGPDPLAPDPTDFYRKPTDSELYTEYRYSGKEITFKLGSWFVEEKMRILGGVLSGVEEGEYQVRVGFKKNSGAAWESASDSEFDTSAVTATFVISKDAKIVDRFTLTDAAAANHPFKFQYGDFTEVINIEDYAYDAAKPLYITRLTINDSLQVLIAQFENTDMIKAFDKDGVAITNLTRTLASGMALKIMDGDTVVNVLTLSVLGDINGDGEVGSPDKAKLNAFTLRKAELDGAYLLAGDIDFDKEIGSSDKAKLNAFTLRKADIYKGLTLTSASPAVQSVAPAVTKPVAVQSAPVTLLAAPVEADEVKVEEMEAVTQPETVSEEMEIAQVSVEQEVQISEQSRSEYAFNTVQTMFAPVQEKRYALAASRRETL